MICKDENFKDRDQEDWWIQYRYLEDVDWRWFYQKDLQELLSKVKILDWIRSIKDLDTKMAGLKLRNDKDEVQILTIKVSNLRAQFHSYKIYILNSNLWVSTSLPKINFVTLQIPTKEFFSGHDLLPLSNLKKKKKKKFTSDDNFSIKLTYNAWNDSWIEPIQFCRWRKKACWTFLVLDRVIVGTFGTPWSLLDRHQDDAKIKWDRISQSMMQLYT